MPETTQVGLTGLTGSKVNAPRAREAASKPVRPVSAVRKVQVMMGHDGSGGLSGQSRTRAGRKAADPSDPSGRGTAAEVVQEMSSDRTHLAATQRIRIGYIICEPGEPLCGIPKPLQPSLTLFASAVTCHLCAGIAERDGITVAGSDAA